MDRICVPSVWLMLILLFNNTFSFVWNEPLSSLFVYVKISGRVGLINIVSLQKPSHFFFWIWKQIIRLGIGHTTISFAMIYCFKFILLSSAVFLSNYYIHENCVGPEKPNRSICYVASFSPNDRYHLHFGLWKYAYTFWGGGGY